MKINKEIVSKVANKDIVKKKHRQIVKAATKLFAEKGYNKTTMREISNESGIELSYLYKYISSKDDILYLFYKELLYKLRPYFKKLEISKDENPVEQLRQLLTDASMEINNFREEARTMYTESRHLSQESLQAVLSLENEMILAIETLINRGIAQGVFRAIDPFFVANVISYLSMMEPMRGWNFKGRYTISAFIELIIDFVMGALVLKENSGLQSKNIKNKIKREE